MDELGLTLIWGIIVFAIVFLVNYFVIFRGVLSKIFNRKKQDKKGKKDKAKSAVEFTGFSYLIPKFNLDEKKMNLNYASILISLANAFIISLVFIIIYLINWDLMFKMLLGFVLLFGLIYSIYELLGRHFVKKGWKK